VFPPLVRLHSLVEDIDDDIGKRRESDYAGLLGQGGGSLTSPSWRPGAGGDEPGSEGSRVATARPVAGSGGHRGGARMHRAARDRGRRELGAVRGAQRGPGPVR
jgi:hypothetical protein